MENNFKMPLMTDNIFRDDINNLIEFLQKDPIPRLTNGPKIWEFEQKWNEWLGTKYSVMVNSGASANELTMLALSYIHGNDGEIIVPPLTWISDISSVVFSGFKPVFCDINMKNLSFDIDKLRGVITDKTKAIFVTHVLGLNALTDELIELCNEKGILLIEDCCESHGATFKGQKVGSLGYASNFSFYFAHHMSTIEGGIISTNDYEFYQVLRALRSHGMAREMSDETMRQKYIDDNPMLSKDFIFITPSHNFRTTEINAVLGLSQLPKLDIQNLNRVRNFNHFINNIDSDKFITDLDIEGQSNYAFILIMKDDSFELRDRIENTLSEHGIEFRRGLSGGGNQLLQPYIRKNFDINHADFPNMQHIHNFSWYIGNHPHLEMEKIDSLINLLNETVK